MSQERLSALSVLSTEAEIAASVSYGGLANPNFTDVHEWFSATTGHKLVRLLAWIQKGLWDCVICTLVQLSSEDNLLSSELNLGSRQKVDPRDSCQQGNNRMK
ncbi:hypothetical protein TNCV_1917911 [Trichonephila clavipes]|uniref:Uncharacterized protein n=1 Tax=Trichonephila clavipes TaxID=2585209 RepID=A0A8X7BBK2_TRICX|nr:hypothetical protein TNCV_1917911 [Trichonephila clavipes]